MLRSPPVPSASQYLLAGIQGFYFIQQMLNPQSKILLPGVISAITSLSTDCGAQAYRQLRALQCFINRQTRKSL